MNERQIFEAALDIADLARRKAFLSQACGADAALRARVDALLTSHAAASQFLETPAVQQINAPLDSSGEDTMQLPPSNAPAAGDDDSEDELTPPGPDLSFLSPSTKPNSIGTLGHYEILNVLGQGAFGIVFRAFDEKLHRHVAIKTMSVQMAATSPPRKRFLREARAAAAIRHENVVQVYSVEEQPLPYLVMEFIDGETLQQKQRNHGPLEVPELLHIGRQISAGLAAAHAQTLIHRDVKPGNILLEKGAEQKVKITDFGLARAADDASLTRSGMISGTPLYMAPEQALGQTLDQRSDLFSLGSVLYELATGRPPFRAPNTVAVLRRVVDDTPRPIQEIIPECPGWLVAIINKLLAKNPDQRYQTAKEVADMLARCQSELQLTGQVPKPAVPPPSVSTRWYKSPQFEAWAREVAAMPIVKQVEAVSQKLVELNPSFDGNVTPDFGNDVVTGIAFRSDHVADISPVRALGGLQSLRIAGAWRNTVFQDLSPLQGMSLKELGIEGTRVSDLSPLKEMKLEVFRCGYTQVSDLTPLKEMTLTTVNCWHTPVTDLSSLNPAKLATLDFNGTGVPDLSVLKGFQLNSLSFTATQISDLTPLQGMPLEGLDCGLTPVKDLSPLNGMKLKYLNCGGTQISSLLPLQDSPLTSLICSDTQISDLSPLEGKKLTSLYCGNTQISDLSPLKGMELTGFFCAGTKVVDYSPLNGMPLRSIELDFQPDRDSELLRSMKQLQSINNKTSAEFWKDAVEQR